MHRKLNFKFIFFLLSISLGNISLTVQAQVVHTDFLENDPVILLQAAQKKLEDAERLSLELVKAARAESEEIRQAANAEVSKKKTVLNYELDLEHVKSEIIEIEVHSATLKEVLQQIMPAPWRILLDVDVEFFKTRRLDFIAHKNRDQILIDLTKSLGLEYKYFHGLTNSIGEPSPLLVVAEKK